MLLCLSCAFVMIFPSSHALRLFQSLPDVNQDSRKPIKCENKKPKLYVYKLPEELDGTHDICSDAQAYNYSLLQTEDCNRNFANFLHDKILAKLMKEKETTEDPNEADFFYIPAYLIEMYFYKRNPGGCKFCRNRDRDIVNFMRSVGPFWDRNAGADHIANSLRCKQVTETLQSKAYPELWHKTIKLCLQDVSLPEDRDFSTSIKVPYWFKPPQILESSADKPRTFAERNISVFFAGSRMRSRLWIPEAFKNIPGSKFIDFGSDHMAGADKIRAIAEDMGRSKFVLIPPGDTPESQRFQQAIFHGAIPIVVSDRFRFPLESHIPWKALTIQLPEANAPSLLAHTISNMTENDLTSMHAQLVKVQHHLTYGPENGMVPDLVLESLCELN